ncbi:MAG: MATE family efflux transporter [Christensenellaceae bacterium]|jgi:putative MATE family efflux protein
MLKIKPETKNLFKQFFPLLIVIALQQLIALTVNLVDNFMLGAYSELAMSGAALVNQIQFMLQQLVAGVGAGVTVLGAQYWGKQEVGPIRHIISIGLKFALLAGIGFCAVTAALPNQVMGLFTNDSAVVAAAVEYLQIMCWTYIIYSVSAVLMYSLQSVQTAFIGTIMSGCTIGINALLNYCLIYGNFGAPEMGIRGAAVATLISRVVELAIILVYILRVDKKLRMKLSHLLSFDKSYLNDYIRVALPIILSGSLWGVAQAVQTAILGHINSNTIAANSIASVIFQMFAIFGFSCANAASVTVGKTIGEGRMELVRPYAKALQGVFLLIGAVSGLLLFLLKDVIISAYSVTPETRSLTITFLTILSITTVGSCYEYPVQAGIIAGGGDTKFAAIVDNCFMWLYVIPVSCLSAFVFHFPPAVTFFILKSDQLLKCIPNFIRCNRYKWIKNLTRPAEEIKQTGIPDGVSPVNSLAE